MRSIRLQGTDGIRGFIFSESDSPKNPNAYQELFIKKGYLTEKFIEHYVFACSRFLLERSSEKLISPSAIVFAMDPRDENGAFYTSAMKGLQKSNASILSLSIAPTPVAVTYAMAVGAAGVIVLTASHNPYNQNGVKVFISPDYRKLFPDEEDALNEIFWGISWDEVNSMPLKSDFFDSSSESKEFYKQHLLNRSNSWLDPAALSSTTLVIDSACGAWSGLASEISREFHPFECVEVNTLSDGRVNEGGGVVPLGNLQNIFPNQTDIIHSHSGISALFENGRKRREELKNGKGVAVAGIFDADGDRSYTLIYNPLDDSLIVLNGDSCIVLQATFLSMAGELSSKKIAALTIESNMGAAKYLSKLGFRVAFTPVGDKWILEKPCEFKDDFLIGGEESGHTIVRSLLTDSSGTVHHAYVGDGYKSFVNTVASIMVLQRSKDIEDFYNFLKLPFEREYKSSSSIYYVKKENLLDGSKIRKSISNALEDVLFTVLPSDFSVKWEKFKNCEDMIYVDILDLKDNVRGSIYIRNSGTEDKISLVLKGDLEVQEFLRKVFDSFFPTMFSFLKNKENSFCKVEKIFLEMVGQGDFLEEKIISRLDESILEIIDLKQIYKNAISGGLVVLKDNSFCSTDLGQSFSEKF
ncbi:MAG: hypothetical protein VX794_00660 [Nitrospinota bacterium]|nr:hypothetical protein [Nitrospinota bacterium]